MALTAESLEQTLPMAHAVFAQQQPGRHPALLTQLALAMLDSGSSAQDAIAAVNEARQRLEQHRQTLERLGVAGGQSSVQQAYQDLNVVLKEPAVQVSKAAQVLRRQRLLWDAGIGQGVPEALETTPGQVRSALDELRAQQREAFGRLQARYRDGDAKVRDLFQDSLVIDFRGVRPDATAAALLQADKEFAKQPFVQAVVKVVAEGGSLDMLRSTFKQQQSAFNDSIAADVAALSTTLPSSLEDLVLTQVENAAGVDAKRLVANARMLQDGLSLGNADAGVYLASKLLGLADPKLGRDIQTLGGAAVEVAKIVKALQSGQTLDGAIGAQMGLAAVSGGTASVWLSVAQLAFSSPAQQGGSSDALVLEQLRAIQGLIEALGARMDKRFDRVDAALKLIYVEMKEGFDLIDQQLSGIANTQLQLSLALMAHERRVDSFVAGLHEGLERLRDVGSNLLLAPCQRWKETSVTIAMGGGDYVACMSRLATQAEQSAITLQPTQLDAAQLDAAELGGHLAKPPLRNLPFLARLAHNEGYSLVPELIEPFLGEPTRWAAAAFVYERLARDWPEYYYGTPVQQARVMRRYGGAAHEMAQTLRTPEGGQWVRTLAAQYSSLSEQIAAALDGARQKVQNQNDPWWIRPPGERAALSHCAPFSSAFSQLGDAGGFFVRSGPSGTYSTIRVGNIGAFLPAFADELHHLKVGSLEHCIAIEPLAQRLGPGPAVLRSIAWFVVPPIAGVSGHQYHLIHDLRLHVGFNYTLPSQFCGIVCQPPHEPLIEQIIMDAWAKGGRSAFESGAMPWTSQAKKDKAEADRARLLAWALEAVPQIRERSAKLAYSAAMGVPMGCGQADGQPKCAARAVGERRDALKSYLEVGYPDALARNDVLRALLLQPDALVDEAKLQRWETTQTPPAQVAKTLRSRAKALTSLLSSELEISREYSAAAPGPLERAVSAFDAFIAEVLAKCASGEHNPNACQ